MAPPRIRTDTHAPPGGVVAPGPPPDIQIAAFGDSLMWGQGNERAKRFSMRFTVELNNRIPETTGLVFDASRSGARIKDLPGERQEFVEVYPQLFPDPRTANAFLRGETDAPANNLYGEIPATFPTVLGQVKMMSATMGRGIDIALVDGGANDINFEDVVNPLVATGRYIERFDGEIRRIVEDQVTSLLRAVRAKCPNAVVMYTGLWPALSYTSSASELTKFFRNELNDEFKWYFNRYVYQVIDVNEMINEAMTRSQWFQGRWTYWTRRAVGQLNRDATQRGPGFVYSPCGFTTSHSAFTREPYLWQDYLEPINDPASGDRSRRIPRIDQRQAMVEVLVLTNIFPGRARRLARTLDKNIDGPATVKRDLQDFINGQDGAGDSLWKTLGDEVHRIQHGIIASLAHPNARGTLMYATRALERYTEHVVTIDRARKEALAGPAPVPQPGGGPPATLDGILRQYRLRSTAPVAGDVHHLFVDSVAVIARTLPNSSRNLGMPAQVVLSVVNPGSGQVSPRAFLLTFKEYVSPLHFVQDPISKAYPYLEPRVTNRFTVDTGGMELELIKGAAFALGDDPFPGSRTLQSKYGLTWAPEFLELEINGVRVAHVDLTGRTFGPGSRIDFGWPDPDPTGQAPKVVLPVVRRARPIAQPRLRTPATAGVPAPQI